MTTDRALGGAPHMAEGKSIPLGGAGVAPEGQGRLVGRRYRLLSPVGRGGMGMVWHAHDVLLDRDVAVKELILPFGLDHAGKQVAHRRMLREARSAARLSHPGIVTVHDVVEEDGRPWIVMELVRAWSLEQAVRQSGPLPVVQAAEIGVRVLDALRHAHAAGVLHRDVKPGNVLLTADRVVLTDFGIAAIEGDVSITQTGLMMGSPAYIPPERLQGRPITHAADLWSFGATLYAAVEGRPPYEGADAVAVLGAVLTQDPTRPQRAGALLPVIEGLLRKNPADRMSAAQAADLLERVLRTHGVGLPARDRQPGTPLPARGEATPVGMLPPLDPITGPVPSRIIETPSGPVRVPINPNADGGSSGPYGGFTGPVGGPYGSTTGPAGAFGNPLGIAAGPYGTSTGPAFGGYGDAAGGSYGSPPGSGSRDTARDDAGGTTPAPPFPAPVGYDALDDDPSEPRRGGYDGLHGPTGPRAVPRDVLNDDALRGPSGPRAVPRDVLDDDPGGRPPAHGTLNGASGPQPASPYTGTRGPAGPGPVDPFAMPGGPGATGPSHDSLVAGTPGSRVWPESNVAEELAQNLSAADPFTGPRPAERSPSGEGSQPGRSPWDGDGPSSPAHRPPPGGPADDDARDGRSPVLLVLAGVGVVGVVAALLFFLWPSDPRETVATPPLTTAGAVPSSQQPSLKMAPEEPSTSAEVPDGFRRRTGAGVTVAVPGDWTATASGGAVTYLGPKNSGRRIQIKKVPGTGDDGLAALTKAKDAATLTDYAQTRLESSRFGSGKYRSSVWEYTYTSLNNVTMHAITYHVSVDATTAYEITFTAPDAEWDQTATRRTMSVLWRTFTPAP
ncbi:serine/threonine-protein kinase [Sphaerisporangium fuscum]|uniref:serine/threonine-protein kinase n=1 Tax=Sphaerisporangium fuscum TaxID=2835868 RepID=UPI002029A370|nr:serine/threonine protein kinase [Sphaerisporangium fuscum]